MGEHKEREGKIASTLGFLLHLLLVAIPKDIHLWLSRRRKDVRGQTIVITGAGSGIGQRMAEIFGMELGANVAVVDIDLVKADAVAKSIRDKGGQAVAFHADVTSAKAMEDCAQSIKNAFGPVHIVICNAAILYFGHTLELTADQLQKAYSVNVLGVLHTIRAFLPDFERENRGQIVAMSSIAGFYGETYGVAYCPTKFAVRGIMECLQMEFRDRGLDGIKCTTLCPYFVRTPMILNMGMRPTSRFIPFMSVNRCCTRAVEAILLEKVSCFIPGYIYIMAIVKNIMTYHVQAAARLFLNCRYVPTTSATTNGVSPAATDKIKVVASAAENEGEKMTQPNGHQHCTAAAATANGKLLSTHAAEKSVISERERAEMANNSNNYFRVPNLLWFLAIPGGLALTFLVYYNPEWIPLKDKPVFGWIYYLGTHYNTLIYWIFVLAVVAHLAEAVYVLYLCDAAGLTHACSLKWFLQTSLLGFPSTSLMYKYSKRVCATKQKK